MRFVSKFSQLLVITILLSLSASAPLLAVVDDFERTTLGSDWAAHTDMVISNGKLHYQGSTSGWKYAAVYKGSGVSNPNQVTVTYSSAATDPGYGGILFVNSAAYTANGYLVFKIGSSLRLYKVTNGEVPASGYSLATATASPDVTLAGGSTLKVVFNVSTYSFSIYVNNTLVGSLADPTPGHAYDLSTRYAGIMQHGDATKNKDAEAFVAEFVTSSSDVTAPTAISTLATGTVTSSSVTLTWTATGDDGTTGTATSYDVRYSTAAITNANFGSATAVTGEPTPKASGGSESFTVTGLAANTTYYFSVRVSDEASNWSTASNSPSAKTSTSGGGTVSGTWKCGTADAFDRTDVGSDWSAPTYTIKNGQLATGSGATVNSWSNLAIYIKSGMYKTPKFDSLKVSYNIGASAVKYGNSVPVAMAILLDTPSTSTAVGYWLKRTDTQLILIKTDDFSKTVVSTVTQPTPIAGDKVTAVVKDLATGKKISYYVNDVFDASITLTGVTLTTWYAGVMQYSNDGKYPIDNFQVCYPGSAVAEGTSMEKFYGDNQTGAINATLADSVAVLIKDDADMPVEGVAVSFAVAQGRADLSVNNTSSFDGKIWRECESGVRGGLAFEATDANASGGKYVDTPDGVNQTGTLPLTMTIYSPQDLVYDFWVRYRAVDNNHNAGYFKLDNKDSTAATVPVSSSWAWYKVGYFNIIRGVHTLKFFVTKKPGWDWDKIVLSDRTRYRDFVPTGTGGSGPVFSNVSNSQGIASTRVTFSTDADTNVVVEALGYKADGTTLLANAPVSFTLNATPGPATQMVKGSKQDTLKGTPGAQMGEPIQALVLDSYGNRVPGITVRFNIIRGTGTLSAAQVTSNSNGEANTYLTLSLLETFYEIQATANNNGGTPLTNSPLTFYVKPGVPPTVIQYVSGNNQEGFSCDKLAEPLVVKVLGNDGNPFANFPIEFVVLTGGGTVSKLSPESYATSVTASTNSNGEAKVYWKPGAKAGANSLEARATGLSGTPITFTATGKPDAAAVLKITSGDKQSGPVGVVLEKPLVVKITDKCGENPVAGFSVVFNVIQGTDAFLNDAANINKSVTVITNSQGLAQVNLFMGSLAGEQHLVRVTAAGMSPEQVTFEATSTTPVAIAMEYVSGNLQDTTVTRLLPKPFVVRTKGPYSSIIGGHPVTFTVVKGSGNFDGAVKKTVASDASGLASATLTIGTTAGDSANIVEATSTRSDNPNILLTGSPIRFIAAGVADLPSQVQRDETTNNQTGSAGYVLLKDIRARVLDSHGNPIADYTVTYEIQSSGGTFISGTEEATVYVAKTGKDGYATAKWKMPISLGPVRCIATVVKENGAGLSGSPVEFNATSTTGDAYKMEKITLADTLIGTAGKALQQRLRVRISDRNNLPKGGYYVTFVATQGGGSLSNGIQSGTQQTVSSSADSGIAEVIWTLGTKSGTANNLVEARASVTQNPTLVFKGTALPDTPSRLVEDKTAKDQVGNVGVALLKPIKVQIVDQYGNGVPQHPVVFTVLGVDSLRGSIDGMAFKEMLTDLDGNASVYWVLGKRPGSRNNSMEVTARNVNTMLNNSPYVFYATSTIGNPAIITVLSDTTKLAEGTTTGANMTEPLKVRVTDAYKNPIANQSVEFEVMSATAALGGTLDGTVDKKKTVKTDSYGMASVLFTLGNNAGYKINHVEARAEYGGQKLSGSPVNFYITGRSSNATTVATKYGNGQSGTVGKFLAEELQVLASDKWGNPVPRQPITFRVIAGVAEKAALGADTLTTKVVETGSDGIARVTWRLGRTAGLEKNMVEASSTNGGVALTGSPQIFTAKALPDITDGKRSKIEAFPVQAPADGSSRVTINVTLKDRYDNAVSQKAVILSAVNADHGTTQPIVTQPMSTTDVNGLATGFIASTVAGAKWVKARDLNSQVGLADSLRITFTALTAFEIIKANTNHGDAQEANVGTALPIPLRVYVRDRYGNPINRFPVLFSPTQGGGQMLDGPQVYTDSTGLAQARYMLGNTAGINFIEARAYDQSSGAALSNSPVRFTETAKKAQPSFLVKVSGDNQSAAPGQQLPNPFRVQVLDLNSLPIYGVSVQFGVMLNDGNIISTNPVKTDMNGYADARVVVGRSSGIKNMYSAYLPDATAIATVSFSATTIFGEASRLTYQSGNNQSGTVNRTLSLPLVVRTEDAYGNAVPNVPVNFVVVEDVTVASAGTLSGGVKTIIVRSATDGTASITYTPGTRAGLNGVKVSAAGLQPNNIDFILYGVADYPYCMTDASASNLRGQVNQVMIDPIQVLVADQYGNPASGGSVQFVVMPQSGSLVENNVVYSNSRGIASLHWKLGKLGDNVAMATASLPCGSPTITFHATGENNNYPVLSLPGEQVINENQQLAFSVAAADLDGDQVYLSAISLPDGAIFDEPSGSNQFVWTPAANQGRTDPYYAVFQAQDSRGGRDLDSVKIVVRNENKQPEILGQTPSADYLTVRYPATQEFIVQAYDADGDQLYYTWKVDGVAVGNSSAFFFDSRFYFNTMRHTITVEVYDQISSTSNIWIVDIITAVEMKTFSSQMVPFQGVKLNWETSAESGNMGFNVLRSFTENGVYEKINSALLPSSADGKYHFIDKDAETGQKYYYKVVDISSSGASQEHGPVVAEMTAPENYDLSQNYPNPFNPTTQIRYQLPAADKVRIEVFNISGQLIRTLVDAQLPAGYHEALWDGRNDHGLNVSSGVYYYRLVTRSFTSTRKMALLK